LPNWLNYIAAACSIIGAGLALLVYFEVRGIRKSYLRRARLPELVRDLGKASSTLSKALKNWPCERRLGVNQIHIAVNLLRNAGGKVPEGERKRIHAAITKLCERRLFRMEPVNDATLDQAWSYYNELSAVITVLEQLVKDTKWD
jgi:hypothetical protein